MKSVVEKEVYSFWFTVYSLRFTVYSFRLRLRFRFRLRSRLSNVNFNAKLKKIGKNLTHVRVFPYICNIIKDNFAIRNKHSTTNVEYLPCNH